jgi:hypothetical protein
MVAFSNKDAEYTAKFKRAQTRMWRDFSDDQHLWIVGSFFQFSAGEGWDNLKGFDISPESAKEADGGPFSIFKGGKPNNIYVVQASKGFQEDSIDPENAEKSFASKMWMLPVVESRDKQLLAPRLARAYEQATTDEEKQALEYNVNLLPAIYESLIRMDQFSFSFTMQSTLAADLVSDPCFVGNEEQMLALKEGTWFGDETMVQLDFNRFLSFCFGRSRIEDPHGEILGSRGTIDGQHDSRGQDQPSILHCPSIWKR